MPIFEHNGTRYNVQDQDIQDFSDEFPEAIILEEHNGTTYRVKSADYKSFQAEFWSMQAPYEEPSVEELQALKQEEEDKYVIGFKAGAKQGWKGMKAGIQYLAGETANLVTGTSRDDAMAYDELSRRIENGELITEENRPWLKRKADKWLSNHPLTPPALREAAAGRVEQDEINLIINQAIEDADGDIDKARRIIAQQKNLDKSWGDKMMEDAAAKMNEMKPTKGFGAWAGNLLPQMIPSGAALAATVITKNPKFATMIGKVGVGAMTAATVGQSMKEARDAGASDSEVWTSGIADGVIEYATEKIPLDRYTRKLFSNTKSKMGAELAEAVADGSSPARKELEQLLKEANKRMGGKLLNGKNVKDLAADMLAEGSSEFLAEAMQTITPILYENPGNYPTFTEILSNGWEGAKAGIFMGSVLGGASKAAEHKMQRNRRKQQGYVDIAQAKDDKGQSDIVEIVGLNELNGNYIVLRDGETSEVAPDNIEQSYRFSFDEFERGVLQSQADESFENGYTLESSQELNDAKNMLEVQAENIRHLYYLAEDEDVDDFLGDDPIEGIMLSRKAGASEEEQQAKLDYINAKATYDGMLQRMRDDIESQVEANNQRIDQLVNRDTKMVVPAKMKQDDRPVYIVGGNVVLHDDGSVNNSESTQDIIIYDEAKGGFEFTSPSAILEVGQSSSAEELKATQASQIAEQYATTKGDQIDGVLPFAQGDTYNILSEDGVQHTAQVIADNGDGSVQVAMDGATEAAVMPKQQVQAMSQAFNKARSVAYNEQKKAQEVAQQEPQAEQKAAEGQPAVVEPAQKPVIPTLKDGTPDYNAMDADMFTEQYVSQFGEELTEKIARNNIKEADKAIASIQKQIDGITDPNKLPALYAKQQESEAKKAKYTTVIVNLGLSEDASEDNASRVQRMKKEATPRIAQLFPDGLPNVESVVMADIATGNKIRWTNKEVNGTIVSKGLGAELGLADSNAERTRRISMIGKDAPTPEEYAESLRERLDAMGVRYDESELRNQILNVYASVDTPKNAWEWLENMSANMQADQEGLDYEEEQMRRAYEQGIAGHPQDMDLVQPEPEIPSQEEYNQIAQEFDQTEETAHVVEGTQGERTDKQGNRVNQDGSLIVDVVNSIEEITDEDFENPKRSIQLPQLPENVNNAIGADGKPVVIKKNIFERNAISHSDLTPDQSRQILKSALYSTKVYGQNQKKRKPYNWVVISVRDESTSNKLVLLEVNEGKENVEIIHWHYIDQRGLEKLKRQAEREDGQLLILPSENSEEVGALADPTPNLPSDNKDTTSEPKNQEVAEKISQAEAEKTEQDTRQLNIQKEIQRLEELKDYPGADKKAVQKEIDRLKSFTQEEKPASKKEFTIEPAQYTNKRGKVLDMSLVKFSDLTKEQQRAAKELAKAEKGWYDSKQGGFMMRSEQSAKKLADAILNNEAAVSEAQPVSLADVQFVSNGEVVFTEPQQPKQATEGKNAPVWQYSISVDSDGFTTLRREDISGAVPVVDAFFTKHADEPQEMLDILRNPLNGMQEILDVVGTTLENQIATRELNRKIEAERRRKYEELRQNGVNGFKIGDKVLYTPEGRSRKPIEATIHDFEEFGANNPVLDVGLAPIMYETTEWKNISKDGQAEPLKQGHSEKPISSTQFIKRVQQASNGFLDAKSARRTCVDTIVKGSRGHIDIDLNYIINVAIDAGMTASDAINFFEAEILPRMPWEYVAKYNLFNVENLRGKLRAKDSASLSNQEEQAINPSGNKLVSDERYAELRERMRKKLGGQMNIGIDPEILAIGTEMAVYHLEKGARKFTEYAKAMIADLGDAIRPYLKAFYNGARNLPEVEGGEIAADMTPYNEVQLFDVANFDKANIDATATAETVVRETEVQQEVDIAQERIKKTRAPRSKKEKKSVTSQEPSLFGEPQNESENGTDENSAANNRGTELGSEELPEAQSVGARTPVQDTAGDRQSKRMRLGDSSRESRSGSQYDVNKNYSNEEISEIVSSITDIVDGMVVITGSVTDDIKAICRQYKSGGIAKKGRGILDEYYTDGKIVDAVSMLIAPYFKNTSAIRVLEPSVGVGNFIEATRNMRTSDVVAFEINDTTARIAKVLYPNVDVNLRSFETEFIDDSGNKKPLPKKFNLVIGNPPYGSHRGLYKGLGEESKIARYEDYFVKRSLDVLEDGGVLAMVLPSSWIDRHTKYGGYTIEAAYRLPSGAFEATQVGTDIVVLKKDSSVPTSEHTSYFEQHPDRILGEVKQRKGRYGRLEEYVEGNIDAALEAIERDHAKQLAARLDVDETSDNLNDIQTAIEETGSVDNAEAIVKNAQEEAITTKDEQTPIEEAAVQSKYKVNLNRSAETAPTSAQFTHEFSEGEIEAFEDTNYDGTINDPTTHAKYANFVGERYVHDFYYAEGDIYAKLAQLEDDRDIIIRRYGVEQYEKQKRLLESVLPKRKGLDEITISPNTAFVKNLTITHESGRESLKNLFEAFCRKLPYRAFGDSTQWEVIGYINNEQVYGQDKQRNQLIRERRKRMANELFVKFLNEELSDDGKGQVVAAFNREYNSVYRPDYSKVPMFSTINKDFKGKPLKLTSVQLAGIGRMTVKGVGVLAHEVGFGKTLSGILAMHEAMTRGFASKPLIVVPNDNILKQWVETMNEVLPNATVNMLGNLGANYDLDGFKINDGEFTIVTYEGLKAMSFSDSTYNHLAAKFSYITEDLNKHQSERDYQKEIEKRNELKGKMKRGVKTSYGFEDFGFDWLTVDEVHNANHIVSKVRLDKSIASDFRIQSQRTSDLGLKTWLAAQYIQEENNGRNVLLLSATPFTNKPLEYYSILSLVANDMLRRKGFFNVDQFFATFMEADNELEIAANGRPVQKTNVRRFRNNGLFQQLLSEFIDIKGEEDNPDLVRPTRQNKEYKIAQNELTAEAMAEVQDLLSDNEKVLQGIGHARAAAFSPYATSLIGRRPKNHKEFVKNSPKIDATIKLIEQNKKDRPDAGQIIYSEVGVEFFPMIRDYLVHESGFKSNEVRIITGATSNNERVNIQTAFNKGEVKVVIGSPAIKEGLNLQENTTDMYILSLPWNFTQLRQIEGRGWRQGNKWENIRINYMLTNDSVDVFMLQRLQLKQGLYNEAMKSGAESLDVSDIDTAELKTQLITDPAVRAEIVTVQEREKLQQEKTQIEADLSFVTRKFEGYNKLVDALNSRKRNLEQFKSFAARSPRDEYWSKRAEDEARKVLQTENEIEQEKENLRKKGVNIDDIDRQVRQSQAAIGAIQKRIEGLDDFQQELTEKYIREDRAKAAEQGHNLSAYIKERKKENQSGFYKIRPKDEDVRFRVIDSKKPFDELEERYEKIDKNNAEALNAWRDEKAAVIQSVGTAIADDLGFEPPIMVFNGANEESLQEAYNHYKNLYAELGMDEPYSYEAFSEKVNKKDVLGVYWPMIDIITSNTANYDYITDYKQVRGTLLHENAHRVIRSVYTEKDLESIWEEAISAQHPVAMMVDRVYGKKSNAGKGNELLAKIIGYIARDRADELSAYIKGGKEIEEKLLNKAGYSLPLGKFALSEILNTFRDDYKRRGDQNLRGGTLGVRGISRGHAASRIRRRAVKEAAELFASQLNTPIRIVEDVNTITDNNAKLQERKRNAKGWFDNKANEVVVVLPNATSVEDVRETIFHEVVGHKGLRELVGKERFNAFLDKVYANASEEVRERIAQRAAKLGWDFHEATEEYIAEQAERGFEERENRNFFEVVRDLFLDMLSKAKIALGFNISDNDIRYMLWRTYQMQRSKGVIAVAEDVLMQQKLGVGNFRARQVSEEEQIATKAKKNGSYLKAPNGKDTNLTPEQWVTVRTKAFKRWFGDWEKAARIEKLRTSESASIVGNEIESSDDMKQYRKNALEYGKSLRGEYRNADTGRTIIINRDSLTEVLHHDGNNVAHIQSIAAIPQMVERGIFITSEPVSADASEKLKNAKEVQYYVCGLNIGGVPYTVKFVVAEYENGERYYDHSLTQIEKGDLLNRAELSSTVADSKSPISGIKDKRLVSILQTNSSKIVDANGEPLVVEHSTWNEDFHTFDISKLGESSGDNGIYGSGFYFGNVGETEMYGDRVIRSYLNVKNPFALPEDNMMQFFDYLVENFDKEGLRDVVVTNSGKSSSIGAIIDAIKEVKANHSRGEYNELIGAMGQYWTPSSAEDRVIEQTIFRKVGFAFYRSLTPFIEHNIGQIEFSEALRNAGYDGVIYDNHEYVAFYPNQIKLADGSNMTFDPDNNDIRFRDGSSTPAPAKPNANARDIYNHAVRRPNKSGSVKATHNLDFRLREAYQDSMLALKELQNAILKETGKTMRDWEDAYTAQNHMSSKNKAEAEAYKNGFFKPLMEEVAKLATKGTKYEDVTRYLIAKHGLERNRIFSERDAKKAGKVWDGKIARDYSGLTDLTGEAENFTEAAEAIVKDFEKKHDTGELWKRINAATKNTLKKNYDSGLMSKEDYEHVRDMFKYYIPLRGWNVDVASDEFEYLTSNRPLLSPSLKAAKGRLSLADDPLAMIGYMADSAIIQGNRNGMKIRFLNFVLNNPTSLATVNRRWVVEQADGTWRYDDPIIPGDATADEVDAIVKAHNEKMRSLGDKATQKTDGLNLDLRASKQEGQEHTIRVRRNGVEYLIFINGDPAAAQAINGLTNPDVSESTLRKGATYVKNFMARAFTSQNPAFIALNLGRDVIWAGTAVGIKEDAAYAKRYKKNVTDLLTSIQLPKLIKKYQDGKLNPNNEVERYFMEFVLNGGETGYTQINTVDDYKRDIGRMLKEAQNGTPKRKKAWRAVFGGIEFLNRSAEDLTRFAVYMTSRQQGRSITRSVTDAKEITVNFNRKGRGGLGADWINFAYIFSNAAIQSITNFARLTKNHPARTMKAVAKFTMAGFLAPVVSMIAYALLGDDDETYWDIPEWVRRNNIVLPIPGTNGYFTIPLPHELRPFYAIGELAMSVLCGKEEVEDALMEAAKGFTGLIPVDFTGNGGNLIVNFTPTVVQPIAQIIANKDYFGTPIYKKYDHNAGDPAWTKAYRGTNAYLVDATRWLNEITGGDNHKRGKINLNPAIIEHLFESYLGGVGKTLNKAAKTISMIWDEDARMVRNIPVVSSFIYVPNKLTSNSNLNEEYYDAIDEFKETERILRGYKRDARMGSDEYAEKLNELYESPTLQRYRKMKGYKDAINKLRSRLVGVDPTTRNELDSLIMELKVDMLDELEKLEDQTDE